MNEREQDQPYQPRHARPVGDGEPEQPAEAHWDADEGEGDVEPFAGDAEKAPSGRAEHEQ